MLVRERGGLERSAPPERAAARARMPGRLDVLSIATVLLGTAAYALHQYDFSLPPFEDAAMLMRYAQHVAAGYGIVWNVGAHPVDGATDFLYLLVLAAVVKAGAGLEAAVRGLGMAAHLLNAAAIYLAIRRLHQGGRWAALLSSAYFALGPGLGLIAAYFGNAFFVLCVTLTWIMVTQLATAPSRRTEWLFALSALGMGLVRPEGVLLAAFMLLALLWLRGLRATRSTLITCALVFGVGGGAYFAWHWWYFGYPLPNPFYIKSGGILHARSLLDAVENTLALCLPFTPAFAVGLLRRETRRAAIFALIPVAGFAAVWLLVSDEINYLMRFQYPVLPIVLIAWVPLVRGLHGPARPVLRYALAASAGGLALLYMVYLFGSANYGPDGRYEVALRLSPFAGRGYTLATTEAGLLPLYSGWNAVDSWGLNDQWVAHHDVITGDYLDSYQPALIMLHRFTPSESDARSQRWQAMVAALTAYAKQHRYVLAASFGEKADDTHDYYVRADLPERDALIGQIRSSDYAWYFSGRPSRNFAPPP